MIFSRRRVITFALLWTLLLTFAACSGGTTATPTPPGEGTVSGTVVIGPLCPVEPCANPTNPYRGLEVVVRTDDEEIALFAINEDGTFSSPVTAGEYLLEIRPCIHLGCDATLPVRITVFDGRDSSVALNIDTGIR
jgi:hypothetical protein